MDVIVTDHHEPPDGGSCRPRPRQPEAAGPRLSLPRALRKRGRLHFLAVCQRISGSDKVRPDLRAYLLEAWYVAVATICDVVPLIGEKVLTHFGLRALRDAPAPGMLALLERTGLAGRDPTPEDIGYQIGPRINASGRMDSAARAVECMRGTPWRAKAAPRPSSCSTTRAASRARVLKSALGQANKHKDDGILVVGGDGSGVGIGRASWTGSTSPPS